eukprot:361824_1
MLVVRRRIVRLLCSFQTNLSNSCRLFASNDDVGNGTATRAQIKLDNTERKTLKSKFFKQKMEQEKSLYRYKTKTNIKNPSGHQHVKDQLRASNNE